MGNTETAPFAGTVRTAAFSPIALVSTKSAKPQERTYLFIGPLMGGASARKESNAVYANQEGKLL